MAINRMFFIEKYILADRVFHLNVFHLSTANIFVDRFTTDFFFFLIERTSSHAQCKERDYFVVSPDIRIFY